MLFNEKIDHSRKLIEKAISKFDDIAVFCSFGKDSVVVTHLAKEIKPDIQVISILTPYKPQETFDYAKTITEKWNLNAKIYKRKIKEDEPADWHKSNPDECCEYYKVTPTKWAKEDYDLKCWITGLRNDEGKTRNNYEEIETETDGIIKLNPILNWSEMEVWKYFAFYEIPVHNYYKRGYRSLGCERCTTLPESEDEDEREGRWRGTKKHCGECGIHTKWKIT